MQATRTAGQEAAEDVFFGQIVIIWARWFLIAAGVLLALWGTGVGNSAPSAPADRISTVSIGILPVVALMAVNFFLHGRYLMERPANSMLVTISCVVDVAMITLVVAFFFGDTGLMSPFFIGYYPVLLAFAFVMPPRMTFGFTAATLLVYALVCFAVADFGMSTGEFKSLVIRLITIGSMGALGAYYWRIQRNRRRAAAGVTSAPSAAPTAGA